MAGEAVVDEGKRLTKWLRRLRGTAEFVYIASLCGSVAMLVVAFIPRSPVVLALPTTLLTGLDRIGGVATGVVVYPMGEVVFEVTDPTLAQRMLYLATILPGLLLVADIARRLARLLKSAQDTDPFTTQTVRELTLVAKITAFGGLAVYAVGNVAMWLLASTMLDSGARVDPVQSPVGWLAVGFIFAAFAQLIARGVAMRTELDTVI
ncbi:hypothetical protein Cci01nite_55470 [Catellatospora citrea]|uniref:DUF2975 family protein n=1 Tax=Catellatospora citrea TaxID=53366 RepID=A0A8J3P1D9_9ACTN|nr:hypothetical protein Cci01nite_55470 [Catellatospora citrea]